MKIQNILLIAASSVGAASAATTIPQVKPFSFVPDATVPLVFNQFDPSLGTLTRIKITTNVTKFGGSAELDNDSANPAAGTISQQVSINLSSTQVSLQDASMAPIGSGITAVTSIAPNLAGDDGDGPGIQTGGGDYLFSGFDSISTSQEGDVSPTLFGAYQGTGTFQINARGDAGSSSTLNSGVAILILPANVSGDVTIVYTYDAVPEPTTAVLGAVGALALLRRRRR